MALLSRSIMRNLLNLAFALLLLPIGTTAAAQPLNFEPPVFLHSDLNGSVVMASDAAGQVIWHDRHEPFGQKALAGAPLDADMSYHGKARDAQTGLIYFGARYYNPLLGRFLSMDPVGVQSDNLHSFNRYAFANNNPYKYTDPDGQLPLFLLAAVPEAIAALTPVVAGLAVRFAATRVYQFGLSVAAAEVGLAVPGAAVVAGAAARGVAPRANSVYEVLVESGISGTSRAAHRASANTNLATMLRTDVQSAGMLNKELGTDVLTHMQSGKSLLNPPGTVWHHPVNSPNVMHLLRTTEHTNPSLQPILHPQGIGGFGTFYGP